MGSNSVIPFPMKVVPDNANLFHLIICYFDTFWIFIPIQFAVYFQALCGCCGGYQVYNYFMADKSYTIPGNTGNDNTGDLPDGKTDGSGTESPGIADQVTVILTVNQAEYFINGESRQMDAAPVIIENRTMLPVRFIAENLGCSVKWEPTARTITILYPGAA